MMSAGLPENNPYAIAAIACTPPSVITKSAPATFIAYSTYGWMPWPLYGVEQAITVGTPAAFAVATLMYADAMCA